MKRKETCTLNLPPMHYSHAHQFIGLKNKETYKVRKAVKKLEDDRTSLRQRIFYGQLKFMFLCAVELF